MNTKLNTLMLAGLLAGASSAFAGSNYMDDASSIQSDNTIQENNGIGIGYAYSQNIYEGVSDKFQPFPLLNLNVGDFFLKGETVGYNAYKDENLSFAFVAQPQFGGYDADDSSELAGMTDKYYLINAGVQARYRLMPFSFTVSGLHDVTGRTAGNSASAKMAVMIPLDDERFVIIPSMSATWEDSNITNYYYGVSSSEATSTRSAYDPGSAVNLGYGLTVKYKIAENWGATLGYVLTQYADDISDSPIVSRKYASTVLAGVSYLF